VRVFFFLVMGTRPVIGRGSANERRHCPRCGDLRNFRKINWRNYFTLFFVPLIPINAAKQGLECVSCGLMLTSEDHREEPTPRQEAPPLLTPGESLVVQCPRCDGRMRVPLRERGFAAICPHCSLSFKIKGQREPVPEALIDES